ncbi:ADP compounds hydrolase NudE [Haemophilus pittmaniae]|uniref:ADP compounds hydrolase NudE n=1 Tax=Haemophilus pittmaniae TaxID=249188 RepID=UPI0028DD178B|nr:ADP compounds hydrolase NudE [Haemophilus pittmaniae]
MKKSTPPSILAIRTVAKSHLFEIQAVDLRFSNGIERTYERFRPFNRDSVMAIAIDGADLLLVREYAMGTEQYELGFVKGAMDVGETPAQSANRELQEEIGFGAHKWTHLRTLKINPQIMGHNMHVLLGEDLYSNQLEGDEPEPLDIVRYPLAHLEELLLDGTFNEARNLAALYTLRDFLKKHQ